jgi:hypothetical protein
MGAVLVSTPAIAAMAGGNRQERLAGGTSAALEQATMPDEPHAQSELRPITTSR